MDYLSEEHRIRLFDYQLSKDSFAGLWNSIANRHHFLRLTLSEPITEDVVRQAITHRDGSISPYSLRVFDKYEIIYEKKGTVIITNPSSSGRFFVVEDSDSPHRYFVGFAFMVGPMTESITGLFVYFSEKGHCYSDRTIICQRVLATYDTRNGILSNKSIFLYHHTLFFTQVHCSTYKLMIYICHIPYLSEEVDYHTSYYTDLILPSCESRNEIILYHRFLMIPLIENKTYFIDMGSLAIYEERHLYHETVDSVEYQIHYYFTIRGYRLFQKEQLHSFLEVASLFPEKEYSDGYPLACIKCHQKTVAATYTFKLANGPITNMGLGSSYCPECRIRFSQSKGNWMCAEVRVDGIICDGFFHAEWECQMSHLHAEDQTLLTMYDPPILKYPYRNKMCIQWIPSQEVMNTVRTARMTFLFSPRRQEQSEPNTTINPYHPRPESDEDDLFVGSTTPPFLLKEECP